MDPNINMRDTAHGDLYGGNAIAIIGLASRFPQEADTTENLWSYLLQARNAMTPFPSDRVNHEGHYHPDPEHGGTFHNKGGHFLTGDLANFDSQFFSMTKSEVMTMDPQQRMLMENVYHALENAGIPLSSAISSSTSVFVSGFNHDYLQLLNNDPEVSAKYKPTGMSNSILANRISWFYDFKGASLTVDTACSSSMVAFHLGCQNLSCGESKMAVVSGVNALLWPSDFVAMSHHGFLSPDGKCYSFDHRANGYSRGEGVGTVIIKRLCDALQDGDTIRAVVRGSAVNQDGRTPGITLPNGEAQTKLVRDVYARAGLETSDTAFIESHGTGTIAGDPIEARAIADAFKSSTRLVPLYVGAMKSSIGHLEGAAGIASIIKSVMILESGIIPPNANFEKANPKILIEKWNLLFPTEPTSWPTKGKRRISINCMGFGGTNAHVILDDAYHFLNHWKLNGVHRTTISVSTESHIRSIIAHLKPGIRSSNAITTYGHVDDSTVQNGFTNGDSHKSKQLRQDIHGHSPPSTSSQIFILSAFDEEGVYRLAKLYTQYFKSLPPMTEVEERQYVTDLSYTLSCKRSDFAWRSSCVASTLTGLKKSLEPGRGLSRPVRRRKSLALGFVFNGQGAQWYAMGRELLVYPVFRNSIEAADRHMRSLGSPWSLLEELLRDEANSKINQPALAHPSCTAIQVAVVDLLGSWGVLPSRVVGHSSGEIAAAYCSGHLGRRAAWKIAYFRGIVSSIGHSARGGMMAVGLSEDKLAPYLQRVNDQLSGELIIACYNSPSNSTISGEETKIDLLKRLLDADSVLARKLVVRTAYHSSYMKSVADKYLQLMGDIRETDKIERSVPIIMFSSVTGEVIDSNMVNSAQYWVDNLVSPVNFMSSLAAACFHSLTKGQQSLKMNSAVGNSFINHILEIGPHGALQSAIRETIKSHDNLVSIGYAQVLNRNNPGIDTILGAVGYLHCQGYSVSVSSPNQISASPMPQMLVKLPPYVFNHSNKLWYEGRITKNLRLRQNPKHDLLGTPSADWNVEEPRWRHIIRLSEIPWIRDHMVTGTYIYPGVGYIAMAIEAAKQISDPKLSVSGYRLRDISIKAALNVPDTKDGIEVMMHMARLDESSMERSKVWYHFRIMSYSPTAADWTEHCTGHITLEVHAKSNVVDQGRDAKDECRDWQDRLTAASKSCRTTLDMEQAYEGFSNIGLVLGPLFRNLSDVRVTHGLGEATGIITIPDIASSMPKQHLRPHVIHPCVLDSMLHLFLVSLLDSTADKTLPTMMMPTYIQDVWISSSINCSVGHAFRGHGRSVLIAAQKYESHLTIWDGDRGEACVSIQGLKASPLSNVHVLEADISRFCHTVDWKPDVELITTEQISNLTTLSTQEQIDYRRQEVQDLQLATMLMIMDALDELKGVPSSSYEGYFQNYYQWLMEQARLLQSDAMAHLPRTRWVAYKDDTKFKKKLYRELTEKGPEGALCVRMGSNIARVLKNEVDPLYLLFGMDDLLERIYATMVDTGDLQNLTESYLEMLGHSRTDLNILEIGAGTGSSTAVFLNLLSPMSVGDQSSGRASSIAKYTYTDVSTGFFDKAKEKYKSWRKVLDFQRLDIEAPLLEQGFAQEEYDIVVAGNILHATADIRKTLKNVRSLLKPRGKLIMHEGIRSDFISMPVAFGQLAGWWLGVEDIRKWCPWMSEPEWSKALRDSGFSGVEINLKDRADPELHAISVMIASAVGSDSEENKIPPEILVLTTSDQQVILASAMVDKIREKYDPRTLSTMKYTEATSVNLMNTLCISLMELECAVLAKHTKEEYTALNHILSTSAGVLWVTGDAIVNPEMSMISGLIRSVRWERDVESPNLITLAVSDSRPAQDRIIKAIIDIVDHQWVKAHEEKENAEYSLKDGVFYTNRLIDANGMNDWLVAKGSKPTAQMVTLGDAQEKQPLKLTTSTPGMLNKLQFETDPIWSEPLGELDVEIRIRAVGLNFRDVMIAMGQHSALTLGNEGAGIVTRVGSAVRKVRVGDHVVYMDGMGRTGTFQTYGRVIEDLVAIIPKDMKFETAAALPSVYVTAIYGLYNLAKLSKGETVLIHSAAGGVGQAAIQLANLIGAEVFATVSTPEKANTIISKYGVQKDHIFSSRDLLFAKGVMRMTKGRGVDVILNSLAGEFLRRSWNCIAPFGRFIEIGKKDAQDNGRISLENPFLRNVIMASVELPTMMKYRPKENARLIEESVRMYAEGKIKEPFPTTVLSYSKLEDSFRTLQSGKGMGKFVLVPTDDAIVPVIPAPLVPYTFEKAASYVLAGGLGGIGRSIALWMADWGAKNIIFLSRSGAESPQAKETIQRLVEKGVVASAFACDVSDVDRLAAVLSDCKAKLPPIKGCIQASMVLKDKMFENMTHEEFHAATKPKVQGSWNLHTLLPRHMDFFVLLSSVTGLVGNRGQANYAAGNTYQDALAAHRISIGLPAVSLDLGTLTSIGYVAENRQRLGHVTHVASLLGSVREDQIHNMIELYLGPAIGSQRHTQVASALTTATQYLSRGMPLPSWLHMPLFTHLTATSSAALSSHSGDDSDSGNYIASVLMSATSLADAETIISNAICTKLSKLLNTAVENINPNQSVSSNGVDSLIAVEFRTWLAKVIKADVPMLDVLSTMAIGPTGLSTKIAGVSKLVSGNLKDLRDHK